MDITKSQLRLPLFFLRVGVRVRLGRLYLCTLIRRCFPSPLPSSTVFSAPCWLVFWPRDGSEAKGRQNRQVPLLTDRLQPLGGRLRSVQGFPLSWNSSSSGPRRRDLMVPSPTSPTSDVFSDDRELDAVVHPAHCARTGSQLNNYVGSHSATTPTLDRKSTPRDLSLLDFEDRTVAYRSFTARLLSHFALVGIIGFATSITFVMNPSFDIAGVRGSSQLHNVLATVVYACTFVPTCFVFALFKPEWCDMTWSLYWFVSCLLILGGARCLVEQLTGARESLVGVYWVIVPAYTFLLPAVHQAIVHIAQCEELPRYRPWKWSLQTIRRVFPWTEVTYLGLIIFGCTFQMAAILGDVYLFSQTPSNSFLRRWIRPIVGSLVRWIIVTVFHCAMVASKEASVKVWGQVLQCTVTAFFVAQLVARCQDWQQLAVVLAFDWIIFGYRCARYWMRILPTTGESGPSSRPLDKAVQKCASGTRRLLDRAGRLGTLVRLSSRSMCSNLPTMNSRHYWGFYFLMQNLCLTAMYVSLLLGYAWQHLRGLHDHPAHRFMFPSGVRSVQFISLALLLELLQDLLAHTLVHLANRRLDPPCTMNAVFPGWLLRPSYLRCALGAALTPMPLFSMIAVAGYWASAP